MPFNSILIANRGEIAIRIARAAAELNIRNVVVYAEDDAHSLHVRKADEAIALDGVGAAAYLDDEQLIAAALSSGCDAVHPGYGFLSENSVFARKCEEAGLVFIGPSALVLEQLGDKTQARKLALQCNVPLAAGTNKSTSLEEAQEFLARQSSGAVMLKALAGGGGRGMRVVTSPHDLKSSYLRCQAEALAAFGNGDLYIEKLIRRARHIEVQIVGDGQEVSHLWERECSLQRRNQKLLEVAPSPTLNDRQRQTVLDAACKMARAVGYRGLGTFEFLLDEDDGQFVFMEANPRIQVEHTVTEAVTGLDLVKIQILLASGASLEELKLQQSLIPAPSGYAVQLRINLESMDADGNVLPAGGTLTAWEPPTGLGVRVDAYGYSGYTTSPRFDSLIGKLIVHSSGDYPSVLRRAYRALCEFRLEGVSSNLLFLQNLVMNSKVIANHINTSFIETNYVELVDNNKSTHRNLFFNNINEFIAKDSGKQVAPLGCEALSVSIQGVLVSLDVQVGDNIAAGQHIALMEAMKMEFVVKAERGGKVNSIIAKVGDNLHENSLLLFIEPNDSLESIVLEDEQVDLEYIRPDLAEVFERQAAIGDKQRPEAVARRRKTGQQTARENIDSLLDQDSFIEYGAMALAAQHSRHSQEKLLQISPADGLIAGIGTVNTDLFGEKISRCMAIAYDYTVFAGTQGVMNHKKTDRMLGLAEKMKLPLVLYAEGGGGRPGDVDHVGVAGLDCVTFMRMAQLSGKVPLVGVVSGRCFAGNAALLGCCDVIIAAENTTLGMAGPAMIEGGGLGRYTPEQIGPVSVMGPNGVIDILVRDEVEASHIARKYLSYFQGAVNEWECVDQRYLRHLIPENRLRAYDIRQVITSLADTESVLELRRQFAPGLITALIRIEGKPFGLIANNPMHLGGAIDAFAGDKAARFMQLCQAHGLPMISLCDTPGFMVGPEAEKQATIRHISRIFVTAANLKIPFFTVVLRKGYGLGAQAMAAGSFHAPLFTVAWPSGEFGAMGIEGAVQLGFAKELAAEENEEARQKLLSSLVNKLYQRGKSLSMASFLEIDAVIDPRDTRSWLLRGLNSACPSSLDSDSKTFIDTW